MSEHDTQPQPPQNRTSGQTRLRELIRERYDLGDVELPVPMAAAHQRRHRKLVVNTSKGKFLVKTYKNDLVVLDNLRFQHRLSDHLLKNGLPVARIQEARNGRRIVEVDDWALELQEFIEGIPMQVTGKSLSVSAMALGRFHEVCRDFPCPDRDTRMWRFSEVPREVFGKLYEAALRQGDEADVNKHCNNLALFLKDASEALDLKKRSLFETGLIHGDWHSGNLIFRGENLAAIVDLEFSGAGCFLEDLAYGMSNLCVRTATEDERLRKRTDLLLDYYQRYRTLAPAEERALYYAVGVKHVTTVSYQSVQMDGKVAGYTPGEWMARLDLQCQWLGKRARAVRWGE